MNLPDAAETIFHAARALPTAERASYLQQACADNAELRAGVEALLRADTDAGQFLAGAAFAQVPLVPGEKAGDSIDHYVLLQQIGEGGFGTVWMAEQQEPVRRKVALKILKLGMDTRQVVARFEQERQALALMDHPHIARVLDAGATATGRPYFVMELVKGMPIVDYCDRNKLTIAERLDLFGQACNAVQHAHGKGIIHRDLKSSNVLVGTVDGRPRTKVIDFGIAKATAHNLTDKTLFTELHQVVGTLMYMSPEQAEGSLDIDTRADVYSLGVLLYELLVGEPPFSRSTLQNAGLGEIQRILREVEPQRPSTRISDSHDTLASRAALRRVEPRRLGMLVRGDLDWIVMKALEKDRARRYETVNGLLMDIQRHVAGQPVVAAPPSSVYRLRKFVRRNRGRCVAATAVLLALIAGGVGTFVQWLRAEDLAMQALAAQGDAENSAAQARQSAVRAEANAALASARADENLRLAQEKAELAGKEAEARAAAQQSAAAAEQRARQLELVLGFQSSMWDQVDTASMGANLRQALLDATPATQREAVDAGLDGVNFTTIALGVLDEDLFRRSLAAVEERFAEQPLVKAWLLQSLAFSLRELGLFDRAAAPQAEALAIRRRELGPEHIDTLRSIDWAAELAMWRGQLASAKALFDEVLAAAERLLGPEDPFTLSALASTGMLLESEGDFAEAETRFRRALAGRRRILGDDHGDTLRSLSNLCVLLQKLGRYQEAEEVADEALERSRRVLGDDAPLTLTAINNLATMLGSQGKFEQAEPLFEEGLQRCSKVLGDDHIRALLAVANMGWVLSAQRKNAEAEPYLRRALAGRRKVLGDAHPDTLGSLANLASVLLGQDKFREAEPLCEEGLALSRRLFGDDSTSTLDFLGYLCQLRRSQGRREEATEFARQNLAGYRRLFGDEHPRTVIAFSNLGVMLGENGQLAEGEQHLRKAVTGARLSMGPEHPNTLAASTSLGVNLHNQGNDEAAEPVLRETHETATKVLGEDNPFTLQVRSTLAVVLLQLRRYDEAEPLMRGAYERLHRLAGEENMATLMAMCGLAGLLIEQQEYAEVVELLAAREETVRRVMPGEHRVELAVFLRALGRGLAAPGPGRDFAAADAKLSEAYATFMVAPGERRGAVPCAQTLALLHEAWHAQAPDEGHAELAAEWRRKLEAIVGEATTADDKKQ